MNYMFPLSKRTIQHDAKWHVAVGEGIACDYETNYGGTPYYVNLMAPFDGVVSKPYWWDYGSGGIWLRLTRTNGDQIEFAHLSKRMKLGVVKAGEVIGITGYTGRKRGKIPHLHIQIFVKGKRVDPDKYVWETVDNPEQLIRKFFKQSWGREPFTGEVNVFLNRLKKKNITVSQLEEKIKFCYDKRNLLEQKEKGSGDKWWDEEKRKWNV